jgi:recombination protein RecT
MGNNEIMVAHKPADLVGFFERSKKQLAMALPAHIGVDRLIRLAATAWSRSADLQKCDLISLFGSTLTAAQLGLEIGVGGQGYLIPYFNNKKRHHEAQFVPGWKGLVDLVARAGRAVVWTGAVYAGDHFDWELGANPRCVHKPNSDSDDWEDLEYVYAIGKITGTDMPVIEVWSKDRIIRHLNKFNKVGGNHYALKDDYRNFEMYARKVPLLQVLKYMPQSVEIQKAIAAAEAADAGEKFTIDGDFVVVDHGDIPDFGDMPAADPAAGEWAPADHGVRAKSQRQDPAPAADEDSGELASKEAIATLRKKIDAAGLGENAIESKFDVDLDLLTESKCAHILAWVKEQI